MKSRQVASIVITLLAGSLQAWDVEHDIVARFALEGAPKEVRSFFGPDEALDVIKFCHYPDWDETKEKPGYHDFSETAAIVGDEDVSLLESMGYTRTNPGWFHRNLGIAGLFSMLAKSFKDQNARNAAFYFSLLTHSIADRSALNHTPLLHMMHFAWDDVNMLVKSPALGGMRKLVTFTPQGPVAALAYERVMKYRPRLLADDLAAAAAQLVSDQAALSGLSAELECEIAWGEDRPAREALARLVAAQVASMQDAIWTAWKLRDQGRALTKAELAAVETEYLQARSRIRACDQAVWKGVFDESLNPADPKAVVGIVCEAYVSLDSCSLSTGGRVITAAAARTLRDHGYAVKAIDFAEIAEKGLPSTDEVSAVLVSLGHSRKGFGGRDRLSPEVLSAFGKYRSAGGKLFVIGGFDPGGITAMRPYMQEIPVEDRPVVQNWSGKKETNWRSMGVVAEKFFKRSGGKVFAFRHDPTTGAANVPLCPYELKEHASVLPLVWLYDNRPGAGQRLVGGRTVSVAWLPEYLFTPMLLSDDKAVCWYDLRLDSTGGALLLDAMDDLLFGEPIASRALKRKDGWWAAGVPEAHLKEIEERKSNVPYDLVLIGDSITHRWKQKDKGGQITWPLLTEKYRVLNLGIGADRTQNVLWRLSRGALDGYKARVFCLMIGVNNSTDPVEDVALGTKRIVELIRQRHPESKILLMPILPHGDSPASYARTDRINALTAPLADGKKVILFDIRGKLLDDKGKLLPGMMYKDNLHPIEGGYRVWYESLLEVLPGLL